MPAPLRKNEPPAAAPKQAATNLPSGGDVQQAQVIYRKNPDYPSLARSAGAKGAVELVATIGTNGRVKSVKVIKGHPLLQKAAVDAVMQWQYKPTMLNGHPVETDTTITLNFVSDRP
jgi:protein TonB